MPDARIVCIQVASRKSWIEVECSIFVAEVLPLEPWYEFQVSFHGDEGPVANSCHFWWRLGLLADIT